VITDVVGIRVGHHTDLEGSTGCTVILCPPGTVGSVEVRGGAPGTRETDVLRPGTLVSEVHAVVLSGGSAFGLATATGVARYLEERGVGFDTGVARVPIVPAAVLFDLAVGDPAARPGAHEGYEACEAATEGEVPEGTVGAGTGATVAKLPQPELGLKGGLGSASFREGDAVVGAIAAVNSVGEIVGDAGAVLAGNRGNRDGPPRIWPGTNTTLVAVATNARLTKDRAERLAVAAHEGISAAVRPAHTLWDGDTAFSLATGEVDADQGVLEGLAVMAVAESIRRGVRAAVGLHGIPSVGEMTG
jgi:L-aminopeptidase/D-esterase-like protein